MIKNGSYQKIVTQLQKEIAVAKRGKGPAPKLLGKVNNYLNNLGMTQIDDLDGDFSDEEYTDDDIAKLLASVNNEHRNGTALAEFFEEYRRTKRLSESKTASEIYNAPHEFFNWQEITEAVENQIKKADFGLLDESVYSCGDLSDSEQQRLFAVFKDSYEKATGASFDQDDFGWRAANWTFFGAPPDDNNPDRPAGGIAVRKQMSNNMYKLVASFGDFRSILRAFDEFKSRHGNDPTWGIVTPEIQKIVLKHDKEFISLPGIVIKAMEGAIKKLSNGEVKSVGLDGTMQVNTPAGMMKKVFICNKKYAVWLLDSISDPGNASRLPVPQAVLAPLIGIIQKLL